MTDGKSEHAVGHGPCGATAVAERRTPNGNAFFFPIYLPAAERAELHRSPTRAQRTQQHHATSVRGPAGRLSLATGLPPRHSHTLQDTNRLASDGPGDEML